MKDLERIDRQFAQLADLIAQGDGALAARAQRVSAWSVAQQLDHMLKVAHAVFARLTGEEAELARGINATGRLLLTLGWLPRGVGKSPRGALPAEAPAAAELGERLRQLRGDFQALGYRGALLSSRQRRFKHPYFGGLDCGQTLRFLGVHTHHHLKIVRDIQRAAGLTA